MHLHWQGKLRGLEFKPRPFRFVGSPDILDSKGRQVQLPVIRPCAEVDEEEKQTAEINLDAALLRAMRDNPGGKQVEWANTIGRDKSNVNRRLQRLKGEKLVDVMLGVWAITLKGEKALKPAENERNAPLKSLRNRRNRKSGLATPIARNKYRNAQRVNLLKWFAIARTKHRNKTRLRCAVAAFSSLREAAPATSATIVHDLRGEKGSGGATP